MKPSVVITIKHCCGLLCLLLFTALTSSNLAAEDKSGQLKQLQGEIKTLTQQVTQTRSKRDNELKKLRSIEKRIASLHKQQRATKQQQKSLQQQLNKLQQQRQQSQQRLLKLREILRQIVQLRHRQGEQGQLKLLLNQQDPALIGRNNSYQQYFNEAQLNSIEQLDDELERLQQLQQQLNEQQQQINKVKQQLAQQQQQLDGEQQQRKQLVSQINASLKSKEARLNRLQEDAKQLTKLVKRIDKEAKPRRGKVTQFKRLKGKLPWPAKGRVIARFGQQRNLGKLTWEGLVISAPMGNNVRAVADGEVVFADWLRGYGLLTIIDHGNGYLTLYGNNQLLNKQVGDTVKQNDIIAAIGDSGGNDQPGLYFEIRKQGKPINPKRWFRGSSRG